ncbi:MAG: transcriptional repressor [Planctomycetes bacterium]|nr:transcriptional repressor [Planctomycetota bacterium]
MTRTARNANRDDTRDLEVVAVESAMRRLGVRWTRQRRLITEVALGNHDHFGAEELLVLCQRRDPRVSRATVYRTLAMLEQAGVVEGLDTGDGGRKFEHVVGHEHHDHMVCRRCGAILEFRDDELERRQEAAAAARGFLIQSHSLKLFGLCRACRERE